MRIRPKVSLFHYFHVVTFVLFAISASAFFGLSFYNAKKTFDRESLALQENYMDTQKGMLISQVDQFIDYIIQERTKAYTQTQKLVKMRVNRGYDIATRIYEQYKNTHDDVFIQQKIIEALRLMRYENGYYFITRMDGVEILFHDRKEFEGKNLLHSNSPNIASVIEDIISMARNQKEGYYDYSWMLPSPHNEEFTRKISYLNPNC